MASPAKSSAKVVVVGGGVAGAFVSKSLQSHCQVVLIEPYALFLSLSRGEVLYEIVFLRSLRRINVVSMEKDTQVSFVLCTYKLIYVVTT
jgi:NADH dehydrogenase FAD-containing subunit